MKKIVAFVLSIVLVIAPINCFAKKNVENKNSFEAIQILEESKNNKENNHEILNAIFKALNLSSKIVINGVGYGVLILGESVYLIACGTEEIVGKALDLTQFLLGKVENLLVYTVKFPFEFYSKHLSRSAREAKKLRKAYNKLPKESKQKIQELLKEKKNAKSEPSRYDCIILNMFQGKDFLEATKSCI